MLPRLFWRESHVEATDGHDPGELLFLQNSQWFLEPKHIAYLEAN